MKLLICTQAVDTNDPHLGFFVRWIEEFAMHCEKVTILCLREGAHTSLSNVSIVKLGNSRLTRVIGIIRESVLRRQEYDAVFVHMNPEYIVVAGWLWRFLGKRIALWYTHKSVNLTLRIAVLFAHGILTASKESFRLPTKKLHVMGHGIDTARRNPPRIPSEGTIRLLTSGRISRVKGLGVLIDAYGVLKSGGRRVTLRIFGAPVTAEDKLYAKELREHLRTVGENPKEVFVGAVPHERMPAMRAEADYFIHASDTGSLDKVVLDAVLSDLIPLSSSDAYHDLFAGFEQLLTYPSGDAAALAKLLRTLESLQEGERTKIRQTLKERVITNHSLTTLIPRILNTLT